MRKEKIKKVPKKRGFAAMSPELQAKLCKMGGKTTAKRHGRAHMSKIGRSGRAKRTRNERAARKASLAN